MATNPATILGFLSGNLQTAVLMIFATAALLIVTKPAFLYREDGRFRNFGTGPEDTIFPFWLVLTAAGTLVYVLTL